MKVIEGLMAAPEANVAIVVARFNSFINDSLVGGALDVLKRQSTRTVIPRFAETFIREVWEMQTRLLNPKPQQIEALSKLRSRQIWQEV